MRRSGAPAWIAVHTGPTCQRTAFPCYDRGTPPDVLRLDMTTPLAISAWSRRPRSGPWWWWGTARATPIAADNQCVGDSCSADRHGREYRRVCTRRGGDSGWGLRAGAPFLEVYGCPPVRDPKWRQHPARWGGDPVPPRGVPRRAFRERRPAAASATTSRVPIRYFWTGRAASRGRLACQPGRADPVGWS